MRTDPPGRWTPWLLGALGAWALMGCGSAALQPFDAGAFDVRGVDAADGGLADVVIASDVSADGAVVVPQRTYREPDAGVCPPGEAPFLRGGGEVGCQPAGARGRIGSGAGLAQLRLPEVWVNTQPGAPGNGTATMPFRTFDDALAVNPATIHVAAGEQHLATTLSLRGALTVLGAGSNATTGTTLILDRGAATTRPPVIRVEGDGTGVLVASLRFADSTESGPHPTGVEVAMGASATIQDVVFVGLNRGIDARAAHLRVDGVTVDGAQDYGVVVREGSDASIKGLLVQNGTESGVVVLGSTVSLTESVVYNQHGFGVVLDGANVPGTRDRLERLVVWHNEQVGILVSGAGRASDLYRVFVTGTRRAMSFAWADGLVVRAGADVRVEPLLTGDARVLDGSMFTANERTGIAASDTGTSLEVHATVAGSNLGGGLLLQDEARSPAVAFSRFEDNDGFGAVVIDLARVAGFDCNLFNGQRAVRGFRFGAAALPLGEGLILAAAGVTDVTAILGCRFEMNQGFGALLLDARVATAMNRYDLMNRRGDIVYRGERPGGGDNGRAQSTVELSVSDAELFMGSESQPLPTFLAH